MLAFLGVNLPGVMYQKKRSRPCLIDIDWIIYSTTGFGSFVLFTTTFSMGGHSQSQLAQVQSFAGGLSQVCSHLCGECFYFKSDIPTELAGCIGCIGCLIVLVP